MCVIVYKPEGAKIPHDYIVNAYEANPHGWGLAWWRPAEPARKAKRSKRGYEPAVPAKDGFWQYCHGMNLPDLVRSYNHYVVKEQPALLHTRIASCGDINIQNLHPFPLDNHGGLLMHNGTMAVPPVRPKGTDSEGLAASLNAIENLPELLCEPHFVATFDHLVSPSKVVLATVDADGSPRVTLLGEKRGVWKAGLWASNDTAFHEYVAYQNWKPKHGNKYAIGSAYGMTTTPIGDTNKYYYDTAEGKLKELPSSGASVATATVTVPVTSYEIAPLSDAEKAEIKAAFEAAETEHASPMTDANDTEPNFKAMCDAAEACEDAMYGAGFNTSYEDNGTIVGLALETVSEITDVQDAYELCEFYPRTAGLALYTLAVKQGV